MSRNTCRMTGMIMMILSIFPLIGGLYLPQAGVSSAVTVTLTILGVLLLGTGVVFYKILKVR